MRKGVAYSRAPTYLGPLERIGQTQPQSQAPSPTVGLHTAAAPSSGPSPHPSLLELPTVSQPICFRLLLTIL